MLDRRFDGGRLAGAQLAVHLQQGFVALHIAVLAFNGLDQINIAAEQLIDLIVGAAQVGQRIVDVGVDLLHRHVVPQAQQRADEGGDGQLAVFINADAEHIGRIGIVFQPGAPVGDHGGIEQLFAGGVVPHAVVNAGRTDQLGNNDALGAVDDEGAGIGHQGKVAHVDIRFLDFAGDLVDEAGAYTQRGGVVDVALLALQQGVLGFVIQRKINEIQLQIALIVGD